MALLSLPECLMWGSRNQGEVQHCTWGRHQPREVRGRRKQLHLASLTSNSIQANSFIWSGWHFSWFICIEMQLQVWGCATIPKLRSDLVTARKKIWKGKVSHLTFPKSKLFISFQSNILGKKIDYKIRQLFIQFWQCPLMASGNSFIHAKEWKLVFVYTVIWKKIQTYRYLH